MAKQKSAPKDEGALVPKKTKKAKEEEVVYLAINPKSRPFTVPLSRFNKNPDIYSRYVRVYPIED